MPGVVPSIGAGRHRNASNGDPLGASPALDAINPSYAGFNPLSLGPAHGHINVLAAALAAHKPRVPIRDGDFGLCSARLARSNGAVSARGPVSATTAVAIRSQVPLQWRKLCTLDI